MKADDDLDRLKDRCHDLYEENKELKDKCSMYEMNMYREENEKNKYKKIIDEVIEYINCNKQKTIGAYGDNEDDDFELCLWEEDIDNLLNILGRRNK